MGVSVKALKRLSVEADKGPDASTLDPDIECRGSRFNASTLAICNRQRVRSVDLRLLGRITRALLQEWIGERQYELGVHLVAVPEITRLNEQFLGHRGLTDVITLDYSCGVPPSGAPGLEVTVHAAPDSLKAGLQTLQGELFVCVDEAVIQARRFRTTWQAEVVRYIVHGLLHLREFDDQRPAARRRMKREENRLLKEISRRFALVKLAKPSAARVNRKS